MKSLLTELYLGNINPSNKTFKRNSEYGRAMTTIVEMESLLFPNLVEKDKEIVTELTEAFGTINLISSQEYFIEGFRLGARLMQEIMDDKKADDLNDLLDFD